MKTYIANTMAALTSLTAHGWFFADLTGEQLDIIEHQYVTGQSPAQAAAALTAAALTAAGRCEHDFYSSCPEGCC